MADTKISALTALAGSGIAEDDAYAIVDTSVTTTKKILHSELRIALAASTTAAGTSELLTQAEYDAGTDTARVPTASLRKIALLATQATTSGTTKDFTIPAGAREITIFLDGVSTDGTSNLLVQIGDAGGIENTGYVASANGTGSATDAESTAGFLITQNTTAADVARGFITLKLIDAATFNWASSGTLKQTSSTSSYSAGTKALTAELTTVRLTSVTPNTFDAGLVGCSYIL